MGALNAAPDQNPFAFELQGALLHHAPHALRYSPARCNNPATQPVKPTHSVPSAFHTFGTRPWLLNKSLMPSCAELKSAHSSDLCTT